MNAHSLRSPTHASSLHRAAAPKNGAGQFVKLTLRGAPLALALLGFVGWVGGWFDRPVSGAPRIQLANAAASREALISDFLAALEANDRQALERLRINQREYLTLILPGSVQPGSPPQIMPARKSEFFWSYLDTRSRYYLRALLQRAGGKHFDRVRVDVPKVERLSSYTAHRDPVLSATHVGEELEIRIGSIAEVDGQFKFMTYYVDD